MYARKVTMQLKANSASEFTKTLESQIIPMLRKQKGFRDEVVFIAPNSNDAFAISLWDAKEHAEAYNRDTYPEIARTLSRVLEGTPQIHTYEVVSSTLHGQAAGARA